MGLVSSAITGNSERPGVGHGHRAGSDPTKPALGDSNQKQGAATVRRYVEFERELGVALGAQVHGLRVENRLIGCARVAYQRAHHTVDGSGCARCVSTIQHQPFDVERALAG